MHCNYLLHVKFLWGVLNVYLFLVSLTDKEVADVL